MTEAHARSFGAAVIAASITVGVAAGSARAEGTFFKSAKNSAEARVVRLDAVPRANWANLASYLAKNYGPQRMPGTALNEYFAFLNCDAYARDRQNEEAMEGNRNTVRNSITQANPPARVRIQVSGSLSEYDKEREGIVIPALRKGQSFDYAAETDCRAFRFSGSRAGMPLRLRVVLDQNASWYPALAMSAADAERVTRSGRSVQIELVVDLVRIGDLTPGDSAMPVIAYAKPVAMYLYRDREGSEFIGAVGRFEPGSERMQVVPAPAPVAAPAPPVEPQNQQAAAAAPAPSASVAPQQYAPAPISGSVQQVVSTSNLVIAGQTVLLAGVNGLAAPYNMQLQQFIAANGGQANCTPSGRGFTCFVRNVDIGKLVIANGAGRAANDASAEYRSAEADARSNRRGVFR